MKSKKIFFAACIVLLSFAKINGQSISPDINGVYCPSQTITFTVTVPLVSATVTSLSGVTLAIPGASGTLNTKPANVTSQANNYSYTATTTTFKFTGNFLDDCTPQSFRVICNGTSVFNFTYFKIQSFSPANISISRPVPTTPTITAPRCQTGNFNISFPNVTFASNDPRNSTATTYGTATQYLYLLPVGWKLGSTVSTGTNWITAANNVTVTSDLSNGVGGAILIMAVNPCGANLILGPQAQVAISRPAPVFSHTGPATVCSGNATYTLNGMPAGSTVQWSLSNNLASFIGCTTCPSVTINTSPGNNTSVALNATVTDCTGPYPPHSISIRLGAYSPSDFVYHSSAQSPLCLYQTVQFSIAPNYADGIYNWFWTGGWTYVSGQGTNILKLQVSPSFSGGYVGMALGNICDPQGTHGTPIYFSVNRNCVGSRSITTSSDSISNVELEDNKSSLSENKYIISPNPVTSTFTIYKKGIQTVSNSASKKNADLFYIVNVYNVNGMLKLTQKNSGKKQMQINISKLPAGLYIVKIINEAGAQSYKIIKQ